MARTATFSSQHWRRRLFLPAYPVSDAAMYARTAAQTVSSWYYSTAKVGPALTGKQKSVPRSYLQLVEVAFVATFRNLGVTLQRIRIAREYAAQMFNVEYPFAQLQFKTEGTHLLMGLHQVEPTAEFNRVILADVRGQIGWENLVGDRFAELDYEDNLAVTWHLRGRLSPVTILRASHSARPWLAGSRRGLSGDGGKPESASKTSWQTST